MDHLHIILFIIFFSSTSSGAVQCENGWVAYKDELCIKAFTNLLTFEETKEFCSSQSNANAIATMVMVKEEDMQNLLASYTQDIFNTVWLGSKYDEGTGEYIWNDGESVTYTNWQEGYPRNSTDTACVELRPINAEVENTTEGKWSDVSCQKRNMGICQRTLSWTLQDAIDEIVRIRKHFQAELDTATDERDRLSEDLQKTKEDLQAVSSMVVPVGSIYIQYFNQTSPQEIWPNLDWEDISDTYAGLFFRTSGAGSENWGAIQNECSPRITQMQFLFDDYSAGPNPLPIPSTGWSEYGFTGLDRDTTGKKYYERLRYYTEGCEIRPRNQAIRIWKRIA